MNLISSSSRLLSGRAVLRLAAIAALAGFLAACQNDSDLSNARAYRPISAETLALMQEKGTSKSAPVLIRTYKKEAELEMWKMKPDGKYVLLKTFPMCRWSGQLGPKTREGDRQVPEGFYNITPGQMNPSSHYYLSFNVGYPNAYDRAFGRTGGAIMVHGACSSMGCFSMTDQQIAEIYAIAREGFSGGQKSIQMQSLPFRMTAENLARHRLDPNIGFWKQLKQGADNFDVALQEPKVGVCNRRYVFNATPANSSQPLDANYACPPLVQDQALQREVAAKAARDDQAVAELVSKGVKPVQLIYADGGQNPQFARSVTEVSRPEALAQGPVEVALGEDKLKKPALVQMVAAAKAKPLPTPEPVPETTLARQLAEPTVVGARAPVEASAATPFFKRWLSFGASEPAAPPAFDVIEPAQPLPADVPLPPRRAASATNPMPKPEASLKLMRGAPVVLPGGLVAYAVSGR